MLSQKKPIVEKYLNPLIKPLAKVDPNIITLFGSIPPLLFFVLVAYGYYNLALFVFPFLAIDLLDGAVARMTGRVTAFGGFLDSTIDRISDFLLISAFGFGRIVRWEIVVLFLFAAFLVSYTRSRGELASNKTISFDTGLIERTERLIGILVGLVGYIFAPAFTFGGFNIIELVFILLLLSSFITVIQRILRAYKKL
jgi:archaetidylinositol phosphate synthase